MAFIIDIPALIVLGAVAAWIYKEKLRERNKDWFFFLGSAIILLFWLVGVALYFRLIPVLGVGDSRYFMWNAWWDLGINPSGAGMHILAVFLWLSYPLWFLWGARRGYFIFGREPGQGGLVWMLRLKDRRPKTLRKN